MHINTCMFKPIDGANLLLLILKIASLYKLIHAMAITFK